MEPPAVPPDEEPTDSNMLPAAPDVPWPVVSVRPPDVVPAPVPIVTSPETPPLDNFVVPSAKVDPSWEVSEMPSFAVKVYVAVACSAIVAVETETITSETCSSGDPEESCTPK